MKSKDFLQQAQSEMEDRAVTYSARQTMVRYGQSETEQLFRELLNDPPALAMTPTQIERALIEMDTGDLVNNNINRNQLVPLYNV